MINTALSENPYYEALSYEWGAPEPKGVIELDGCIVEINPNLRSAL
jgi:hypothetical protein